MFTLLSIEIKVWNSSIWETVVEEHYDIKETTFDSDLDYTKIPKPFLAYALNGTITTVS